MTILTAKASDDTARDVSAARQSRAGGAYLFRHIDDAVTGRSANSNFMLRQRRGKGRSMLRNTCILAALLLISQAMGCAMCACPYDYTGPVPAEGFGFQDRAGSVLQLGGINEGQWNAEMDQDAMGDTIVDPRQNGIPQGVPQGEPVLAPQPQASNTHPRAQQTAGNRQQPGPVVQRVNRTAPRN